MKTKKVFEAYDWVDITDDIRWKEGWYTHPRYGIVENLFCGTKSRPRFSDMYCAYGYFNGVGFNKLQVLIFKRRVYALYFENMSDADAFIDNT